MIIAGEFLGKYRKYLRKRGIHLSIERCVPLFLLYWLNRESSGLKNRHPERMSRFESMAQRSPPLSGEPIYGIVAKRLRRPVATRKVRVRFPPMPLMQTYKGNWYPSTLLMWHAAQPLSGFEPRCLRYIHLSDGQKVVSKTANEGSIPSGCAPLFSLLTGTNRVDDARLFCNFI